MFKSNQFKIVLCACRNSYSPANRFLDKNCLRICDSSYVVHKSNFVKSISQIVMASGSGTPVSSSNGSGGSKATHSVGHSVNRLAKEKSPYLLQHATNPVDWYPWGEEAIQKAKNENKLIFLSVGYSTCHWCHVMEKESFEDPTVARILNENYVSIKVDREERPDIDKIYMTFVLMINGSGGWPMSVWMTPDLVPITAGTYYPPTDRWGMPGFKTILMKIAEKWTEKGDELKEMGPNVIAALQRSVNERDEDAELTSVEKKFDQAVQIYKRNFDEEWGGWGKQPKFPEVSKLNFLLHAHFKKSGEKIADMVLHTLVKMANGGIHDHVFGGFARYSVDKRWHIPHFEKMLYDQGQLLVAYSNAYRMTHNEFFIEVADKILHYLMKDLQHPLGGFFSGEDADSLPHHDDRVKIEGAFYAWNYQEVCDAFESNAERFDVVELADSLKPFDVYAHHYDIQEDGNVEPSSDPHGHLLNKNILFVDKSIEDTAKKFNVPTTIIKQLLSIGNEILYEIRCKRPRPHLDTKIICAWNGLTLSGISKLAQISDLEHRGKYLTVAKKLLEFIRKYLYDEQEKTLHRACYGEGVDSEVVSNTDQPIQGFLDDYAFLIKGLLDYYVATHDIKALEWAVDLQKTQDKLFWDEENGGYFYTQADTANVIVRLKEDHDGAEPCGNSMAVHNLMLLNTYYEDAHFKERAKRVLDSFEHITPFGYSLPHMLSGLLLFDNGIQMLVIVGPDNDASHEMFKVVSNFFVPGLVPIQIKIERPHETTRKSATQFKMLRNLPTAYLCHNQICQLPITEPTEMKNLLTEKYVYSYDQI